MALAYYNEFNPEAVAMLRQLIADGHCAPGDVDERSITEVTPDDLKGYTQCHFFAGIGGWSMALRLAGWPNNRPVWTGSAPCQPFSSAGKQKGKDDERHLFPAWLDLIRERQPATIFGEQVASAVAHGWLDDVYQGLEAEGYAVGAAVLPACSVGAPHRRDRLWFVAHSGSQRRQQDAGGAHGDEGANEGRSSRHHHEPASHGQGCVANPQRIRQSRQGSMAEPVRAEKGGSRQADRPRDDSAGFWDGATWFHCPAGKSRPIESSIPLLAYGIQHRRPILHAIGNAIVPQVAAEFIKASI